MRFSSAVGALAHDAMHRLPGMPDHARAGELNARQQQRPLPNRPLPNRPLGNRPLQNPNGHHQCPARLFPRRQAWLSERFGPGSR
jgi:hypothetical protein